MFRPRVIPCLLLQGQGLVKTVGFRQPKYLGDPINAVKIFNDREVDELVFLDITATREGRDPGFDRVRDIASECFMPICYGGGVRSVAHAETLIALGVEKVLVNSAAAETPELVTDIATLTGSSSVIVGVDVRRDWLRRPRVHIRNAGTNTGRSPAEYAREMADRGAGEIFLTSVDRDGAMQGLDLTLVREVASAVSVPVVACGGVGSLQDIVAGIEAGASAVSAGSLFVFAGPHRAVLVNYPSAAELKAAFAAGRPS